jgi:hypothetical protein
MAYERTEKIRQKISLALMGHPVSEETREKLRLALKGKPGRLKHGKKPALLYYIWKAIKARCFNKKVNNFRNYGGKGIIVCSEWKDDFLKFRTWALRNGYQENLTIDRINNDGNYEPSNCRWITKSENSKKSWKDTPVRQTIFSRAKNGRINVIEETKQ